MRFATRCELCSFAIKYENWSTARAWLARENVLSGCYARTASRWRQSASSRQSIRSGSSRFAGDTLWQIPARTGRNISISIVGSELTSGGFASLNSTWRVPSGFSIWAAAQDTFSTSRSSLGHSGVGLDMDRLSMFREITRLLGVRRVVQQIQAFRPLPSFGQKFDVITAFMICFNNHKMPGLWGVPEWEFFLDDLGEASKAARSRLARIKSGIRRNLLHAAAEGIFSKARRQNRRAEDYL